MCERILKTKCIFDPKVTDDGIRISVMSRHTLNDGVTVDSRLEGKYDEWMKELAPPDWLVGRWYRGEISWEDFEQKYYKHLQKPEQQIAIKRLISKTFLSIVTVMCVEKTPENCHRRLLAEYCGTKDPNLKVVVA